MQQTIQETERILSDQANFCRVLHRIKKRSQDVLARRNAPLEDVLKLLEHVANMKKLLADIDRIRDGIEGADRVSVPVDDLREYYFILDSTVNTMKAGLGWKPSGTSASGRSHGRAGGRRNGAIAGE